MPDPTVYPTYRLPQNINQGAQETGPFNTDPNPANAVQLALLHLQSQMPTQSAGVGKVTPDPSLSSGVQAQTDLWGNIQYNPASVGQVQSKTDDLMAHELTHVGQTQSPWGKVTSLLSPLNVFNSYENRPREQEAFATEDRRQANRKDIQLPPDPPPVTGLKAVGK